MYSLKGAHLGLPLKRLVAVFFRSLINVFDGAFDWLLATTSFEMYRVQFSRSLFTRHHNGLVTGLLDFGATETKLRMLQSPEDQDVLDFVHDVFCTWLGCPYEVVHVRRAMIFNHYITRV